MAILILYVYLRLIIQSQNSRANTSFGVGCVLICEYVSCVIKQILVKMHHCVLQSSSAVHWAEAEAAVVSAEVVFVLGKHQPQRRRLCR